MNDADLWSLTRGIPEPPAPLLEVGAGPATMFLDRADVRRYSVGGVELLRRVYVAVRNVAWETLPAVVSEVEVQELDGGGLRAAYEARVTDGEIVLRWTGLIALAPSGELTYSVTGTAGSSFDYARFGLNILHPPSLEGRPYRVVTDGGVLEGEFPPWIGPQPLVDGEYLPLLPAFRTLEVAFDGPGTVQFLLRGDEFEIEDQRNWLDASYKTYSTPMSLGVRHAEPGESIAQEVEVRIATPIPNGSRVQGGRRPVALVIEDVPAGVVPGLGLGLAGGAEAIGAVEGGLLAGIGLEHLRLDVRLSSDNVTEVMAGADASALECGCGLEVAAFLDNMSGVELDRLAAGVKALTAPLRRVLAFSEHELVTSPAVVASVREAVGLSVPVFGGTNLYFAELNRDRPDPTSADGFSFSANPQVHTPDDRSLTETPQSLLAMLESARRFLGDRPIVVSPVTLLPRFNPDAPGARTVGVVEPPADERQASLVCAVFAALAVKFLAAGGALAATMFETTGAGGVAAAAAGSRAERTMLGVLEVPSGAAFPVSHVLSVWGRWSGHNAVSLQSSEPRLVDGVACRIDGRLEVLLANATAEVQAVELGARFLTSTTARLRTLDAASVNANWAAGRLSSGFSDPEEVVGRQVALELTPYAVAHVVLDQN